MDTRDFKEEMSQDFFDYCYQTNAERAFSAIDGLKPGQRACLFEMYRKNYLPNKPHVKSAKVSGGVMAELWPHGDVSIYETFARMSQPFTNNIPLCEFHGSNGNQIIPEPASPRYTEVRLSKPGLDMFNGIKKKCVPFIKNFDETTEWPALLPSPLPMLFINGSEGIGTTIAQKFLPYDANEISNAYLDYIKTGNLDYSLAPSFPTGGIIINKSDLPVILKTGKGRVDLRAKTEIKNNIITITEICYQTCVRDLMEEFKKLYDADELPGVDDIQNMSGKNGVKIKIICDKKANPTKVLNTLFKKTNLQKSYSANQNLLINKIPTLVNLKEYFDLLYAHNEECLIKESTFDKNKAEIRKEEVEGLLIAIADIDKVINIVRNSDSKEDAKNNLISSYNFTELQANCILKMTIGQLTKLDGTKLQTELNDLITTLNDLNKLLSDANVRKTNIIDNLKSLIDKIKIKRTTEVTDVIIPKEDKEIAAVVPEDVVVIVTQNDDIKRIPRSNFKTQKRNGKGVKSEQDAIAASISTNTVDNLLFFTNKGKMYRLVVDNVPSGTNSSKGTPISNLINLEPDEKVVATTAIDRGVSQKYIIFATKNGVIKKSLLEEYFKTKRANGIVAIKLKDNDVIVDIAFIDEEDIILATKGGMTIHFETKDITPIGRSAAGVKGIKLNEDDEVISAIPLYNTISTIASFAEKGVGRKSKIEEFPIQGRGGKGVKLSGPIVSAIGLNDNDNLLICGKPSSLCVSAKDVPLLSRTSNGVIMIKDSKIKKVIKL